VALVHHDDLVRALNGRQPVRDDDRGAARFVAAPPHRITRNARVTGTPALGLVFLCLYALPGSLTLAFGMGSSLFRARLARGR